MSIKIMSAVWELDIPSTAKFVLLALADHADDDGCCYPGRKYVARKCSITDRSVTEQISKLQELGLLEVNLQHKDNGGQKSHLYRLLPPPGTSFHPPLESESTPPGISFHPLNKDESSVESPTTKPRARKKPPPIDPKGSSADLRANDDDDDIHSCKIVEGLKEAVERNPDDKVLCRWYDVLINIDLPWQTVATWFFPFTPTKLVRGVLKIATDNEHRFDWCRGHYSEKLSAMKVKLQLSEGVPIEQS